jgi:hypothetical protein
MLRAGQWTTCLCAEWCSCRGRSYCLFFDCPTDATSVTECQSCSIVVTTDDTPNETDLTNDLQCQSCGMCPDTMSYDCSNLAEGACVIADCDGCVDDPTPTPTPPITPTPLSPPTPPSDECVDFEGWQATSMRWLLNSACFSARNMRMMVCL